MNKVVKTLVTTTGEIAKEVILVGAIGIIMAKGNNIKKEREKRAVETIDMKLREVTYYFKYRKKKLF